MLNVRVILDLRMTIRDEEEGVLRQPTDAEYHDDHDHHLHHLQHLRLIIIDRSQQRSQQAKCKRLDAISMIDLWLNDDGDDDDRLNSKVFNNSSIVESPNIHTMTMTITNVDN